MIQQKEVFRNRSRNKSSKISKPSRNRITLKVI